MVHATLQEIQEGLLEQRFCPDGIFLRGADVDQPRIDFLPAKVPQIGEKTPG